MLEYIICVSLISSFVILFITKLGIRELLQEKGPKLISDMANCDFCISFWVNVVMSVIIVTFVTGDLNDLFIPILTTPLTRLMI